MVPSAITGGKSDRQKICAALAAKGYEVLEFLSFRRGSTPRCVVSAVDLASPEEQREVVAVKCFLRGAFVKRNLLREVLYHRGLVHKHIVPFKRVFLTQTHLCIVMTFAPHGTVQQWLTKAGCFPEAVARSIFQQIACAVDFCHEKGVFNRDIKLENLVMTIVGEGENRHFKVQLCDFGFSKGGAESTPKSLAGTLGYIAPEVVQSVYEKRGYDGTAADMWSLGVCLYRLLFGDFPPVVAPGTAKKTWFMENEVQRLTQLKVDIPEVQQRATPEGVTINFISDSCRDLLKKLLCADPVKRMTVAGLVYEPWFVTDYPADLVGYNDRLQGQYADMILNQQCTMLQDEPTLMALIDEAAKPPPEWTIGSAATVASSANNFSQYGLSSGTMQTPTP